MKEKNCILIIKSEISKQFILWRSYFLLADPNSKEKHKKNGAKERRERKKDEREKPLLTKGKTHKVVRFLISPKKKKPC